MRNICLLFIAFALIISGCATARHAVPMEMLKDARFLGEQDVRAIGGISNKSIAEDLLASINQEEGNLFLDEKKKFKVYSTLAISGGAASGAFGAGLLKGWSESGTRPLFKVVTGISTGAIIAPFAFLGRAYDKQLEEFYTIYSTKDLLKRKNILQIFFGNSLASNAPLEALIKKYFTDDVMAEIKQRHEKGFRLYVGTTNLDAQRLVIWDMGRIASIGSDESLQFFQKIILASASIPTAFPPVFFETEINGEFYNEMHVDGGVINQVFFLFDILKGFDVAVKKQEMELSNIKFKIFVIRNGYVDPVWQEVPDRVADITGRSVDTMINMQGVGDLYKLYMFTQKAEGDFNLAYIPQDFKSEADELFDPAEMSRLFQLGYEQAKNGYTWQRMPPGLSEEKDLFR